MISILSKAIIFFSFSLAVGRCLARYVSLTCDGSVLLQNLSRVSPQRATVLPGTVPSTYSSQPFLRLSFDCEV